MNIKIPGVFILLSVIMFSSCNNNECNCSTDIYNKWEVTEFMSVESVLYAKDNGYNPVIEFKTYGTIAFQLDANTGTGTFKIVGFNELEITNLGWTDMCCDSEFSEKFVEMLPQVTSYSIEENKLKLYVPEWGWINLSLISD